MMGAAPDGGWGWVIVFCSAAIHMLTVGGTVSLSVMYVYWLEEFSAGRGATSWVISVAAAVTYGIGPIPAHLASKYGYRLVVMAGGVIAASGYILAYFATNVYFLVLAIGLVTGTGGGFCYLPATVTVARYFDKKRSLAIGLGCAGVGIGSFVCAPIVHWLIQMYGWRGALLMIGAIQLNLCVIGLLLRPLPSDTRGTRDSKHCFDECDVQDALLSIDKEERDSTTESIPAINSPVHPKIGKLGIIENLRDQKMGGSVRHLSEENNGANPPAVFHSVNELRLKARIVGDDSKTTSTFLESKHSVNLSKHSVNLDILMCGSVHSLLLIEKRVLHYDGSQNSLRKNKTNENSHPNVSVHSKQDTPHLNRLSWTSSLYPEGRHSSTLIVHMSNHAENDSCNSVILDQLPVSESHKLSICRSWVLLKNPIFLALLISNVLTNLSFLMPVLFMVDRAIDYGIASTSAALLISINGAGNVFGRVFFGYISDHWFPDRLILYIACLSACGVATSMSSLCGGVLWLHGVYALTFGCFIGAYCTLAAVVTVDVVGVEAVGHAYGLMLLFTGAAGLVGPPLAGWIFDVTGNYDVSYLVHGLFILVSALMLIPVAAMRRR